MSSNQKARFLKKTFDRSTRSSHDALAERVIFDSTEAHRKAVNALVEITNRQGLVSGSGFIVNAEKTTVVTANHVVGFSQRLQIKPWAGNRVISESACVYGGLNKDVAILKLPSPVLGSTALSLADPETLAIGQPVMVLGSPFGLSGSVTMGVISALRTSSSGTHLVQFDASSNPGYSGGPVLNSRGEVVGLVSFGIAPEFRSGVNFAISVKTIEAVLRSCGAA
jgi:S1-C subfamily serine protease